MGRTNKSHVTEFGTMSFTSEPTTNFYGNTSAPSGRSDYKAAAAASALLTAGSGVTVDSRYAELQYAYDLFHREQSEEAAAEPSEIVAHTAAVHKRFQAISMAVAGRDVASEP